RCVGLRSRQFGSIALARGGCMLRHPAHIRLSVALMWTSVTLLAGSASGQDLKSDVDALKAENAVVRDLLRKMEEQQRALLEQVDRLQRRLDEVKPAAGQLGGASQAEDAGERCARDAKAQAPAPTEEH